MPDQSDYSLGNAFEDASFVVETLQGFAKNEPGSEGGLGSSPVTPSGSPAANPGQSGTNDGSGVTRFRGGWSGPGGMIYNTYAGTDIVAQIVLPNEPPLILGEVQTLSYSVHRENVPVRFCGHVSPSAFVKGARTIAGSLIFTVFNNYAFYRSKHMQDAVSAGLYPIADMLPPFDIVLTFANESGSFSKMKIYGVTIVDEGQTMSIDDIIVEQTYSFMARGIQPMTGHTLQFSDEPSSVRESITEGT